RLIDKIPVDGPGGKVIVYLDHEKQVTGIERIWREIERVHRPGKAYRTPQNALDDMARHYTAKLGIIEVQEMRFGYFEEGWRSKQQYMQPVYLKTGLLPPQDAHIQKRPVYVTPPLSNAVAHIPPPLKQKPRQLTRQPAR